MSLDAVIVADDENIDLALKYDFRAIECPNDTMGRKWNDGISAAQDYDVLVMSNSDLWIHPSTFDVLPRQGISAAQAIDFVDLPRGVVQHAHADELVPWLIPRTLFEPSGFRPLPDQMQHGMEPMLRHALGRPQVQHRQGVPAVNFNSAESMHPYAGVRNSIGDGIEHELTILERHYPAHLVEMARGAFSGRQEAAIAPVRQCEPRSE